MVDLLSLVADGSLSLVIDGLLSLVLVNLVSVVVVDLLSLVVFGLLSLVVDGLLAVVVVNLLSIVLVNLLFNENYLIGCFVTQPGFAAIIPVDAISLIDQFAFPVVALIFRFYAISQDKEVTRFANIIAVITIAVITVNI